jgi:hypothetical protein
VLREGSGRCQTTDAAANNTYVMYFFHKACVQRKTPERKPQRLNIPKNLSGLIVAMHFLTALMALLRLQAHRRDGARIKAFQRNRITGHVAIAKFAFVNSA